MNTDLYDGLGENNKVTGHGPRRGVAPCGRRAGSLTAWPAISYRALHGEGRCFTNKSDFTTQVVQVFLISSPSFAITKPQLESGAAPS